MSAQAGLRSRRFTRPLRKGLAAPERWWPRRPRIPAPAPPSSRRQRTDRRSCASDRHPARRGDRTSCPARVPWRCLPRCETGSACANCTGPVTLRMRQVYHRHVTVGRRCDAQAVQRGALRQAHKKARRAWLAPGPSQGGNRTNLGDPRPRHSKTKQAACRSAAEVAEASHRHSGQQNGRRTEGVDARHRSRTSNERSGTKPS
jgi:hypothetical protein